MPLLLFLSSALSSSYTELDDGSRVRWLGHEGHRPYVPISINAANQSGLSGYEVEGAVVRALLAWQAATGSAFDFDVWTGRDTEIYPATQDIDGFTTIHFASTNPEAEGLTARQGGHTTLTFDDTTGEILEADVVLNDIQFALTTDPGQTNYADAGFLGKTVFLDDVVFHEIGHLLGLGHTGVAGSSMFAAAWSGQHSLGCSDIHGVRELYRPPVGTGAFIGHVDIDHPEGWRGVELLAIAQSTRSVVASTFADAHGRYELPGLHPDQYVILAQPYLGEPGDLPWLSSGEWGLPCDASRAFSPAIDVGANDLRGFDFTLGCNGGAEIEPATGTLQYPFPLTMDDDGRIMTTIRVDAGDEGVWFSLPTVEGWLSLDALSTSLFSAGMLTLEVTDEDGLPLSVEWVNPLRDSHDTPEWDGRLTTFLDGAAARLLHVRSTLLIHELYPAASTFVDDHAYGVLVGEVTDRRPGDVVDCLAELDADYVSRGGLPQPSWDPAEQSGGCSHTPAWLTGWAALGVLLVRRKRRTAKYRFGTCGSSSHSGDGLW